MQEDKGHRKYDRQFKEEAVRLATEGRRTVSDVAHSLGIHENQLYAWKRQYKEDPSGSFPGKGHLKPQDEELRKLQKENANLNREYVNCNLCGYSDYTVLFKNTDDIMIKFNNRWKENHSDIYKYDTTFTTVICNRCGLVYVNPRLKSEILEHFYEEYLPEEQESNEEMRNFTFANSIEKIRRYKERGKLLDIGCANGYFLNKARKEGFDVEGVEKSKSCSEYAKKEFNIKVFDGDFLSYDFVSKEFDVITLFHTIEHMYQPLETLQKAFNIMNDKGVIMITVPNVNRAFNVKITKELWGASCEGHLYAFSTRTLKEMLKKAGFSVIYVDTNQLPYDSWMRGSTIRNYLVSKLRYQEKCKSKYPAHCQYQQNSSQTSETKKDKSILKKIYHKFLIPSVIYFEEAFNKGMQIELIAQK